MAARTRGATMAHPEENLHTVSVYGPEHHHHARLRRKAQLRLRHRGQPIVTFAEIHRPRRDHDPDRLIGKDHKTLFNAQCRAS